MSSTQVLQTSPVSHLAEVQQQVAPTGSQPNVSLEGKRDEKYRKIIRGVAITEVVLGLVSITCGILLTVFILTLVQCKINCHYNAEHHPGAGEGIWCGIWVVIAGAIGICAGGQNSNIYKVNTHMIFGIVGAVFSAAQFAVNIAPTGYYHFYGANIAFIFLSGFCAFSSFVLCIVSIVYSILLMKWCSTKTSSSNSESQSVYYNRDNQQPVAIQGSSGTPHGYVLQGSRPAHNMIQQSSQSQRTHHMFQQQAQPQQIMFQAISPQMVQQPVQCSPRILQQPIQPVTIMQPSLAYNGSIQQPGGNATYAQQTGAATQVHANVESTHERKNEVTLLQTKTEENDPPSYSE